VSLETPLRTSTLEYEHVFALTVCCLVKDAYQMQKCNAVVFSNVADLIYIDECVAAWTALNLST